MKIYFFFISMLVVSCNKTDDRYAFLYETYGVENPEIIRLDKDIVNLNKNDFEIISRQNNKTSILGNGVVAEIVDDSILIVIERYNLIKKVNIYHRNVENELYSIGRGPGEYEKINDVVATDSSFLIVDREGAKLTEYDYDLQYLNDWKFSDLNASEHGSRIDFNDSRFYYPTNNNEEYLFSSINLRAKSTKKNHFHKRLIPIGKQPRTYNEFIVRALNNKILITSTIAPIFFIYDKNFNLEQLYKLDLANLDKTESNIKDNNIGSRVDNRNELKKVNPPPKILDGSIGVSFDAFKIFDAVFTEEQIFIYFSNRHIQERYMIVLEKFGNGWRHSGSYRFYLDDKEMYTVFDMAYREPWLYLSSQFEESILRVNVNELE